MNEGVGKMSLLDAAYEVLKKSGSPMTPADIIRPIIESGILIILFLAVNHLCQFGKADSCPLCNKIGRLRWRQVTFH